VFSFDQYINGFLEAPNLKRLLSNIEDFEIDKEAITSTNELPKITRLGKRMEFILLSILKEHSKYELLAANVQLKNKSRTIGEIDYIIGDKKGNNIHLELTTKLYLLDQSLNSELLHQWIGPNRKDFLYLKLNKLREHQFLISDTQEFKAYSSINKIPTPNKKALLLKCQLFLPFGLKINLPQNFADCICGEWLSIEQFEENYKKSVFYLPEKKDWFIMPESNSNWFNKHEILKQIKDSHERLFSPLVWIKKNENEYRKIFVVWW